jgi:hypothetical protein
MIVSDIFSKVSNVLGVTDQTYIFQVISDAIELGANKGIYDPLIGYLTITSGTDNLVYLPRDVEVPIRININSTPAFFRDRFFEFQANTDGTPTGDTIGFTWDDRTPVALQKTVAPTGMTFKAQCANAADNNKTVTLYGTDINGVTQTETLTMLNAAPVAGTVQWSSEVTAAYNNATAGAVSIIGATDGLTYAVYQANETEPHFRRIRVSVAGATLRIMYRRRTFKIAALTDYIPLHSELAMVMFCKAVKLNMEDAYEAAQSAEQQAVRFLEEKQKTLESAKAAAQNEVLPTTNRNIGVADAVIVGDIYDEACDIFGQIGRAQMFDRITSAIELLQNACQWDASMGYCDITTDSTQYFVVLPRYVDRILSLTVNTLPALMRNKWFEFSLSGNGSNDNFQNPRTWDNYGDTLTVNPIDPKTPLRLAAICDDPSDDGVTITVYGLDDAGNVLRTNGADGLVVTANTVLTPTTTKVSQVTLIVKGQSNSFIKLVQINADGSEGALLGYYHPDELYPRYQKIRIGQKGASVRLRYRKRDAKVKSLTDFINLRSRTAILQACRALRAMKDDPDAGESYRQNAIKLLSEEQNINNPGDAGGLNVDQWIFGGVSSWEAME